MPTSRRSWIVHILGLEQLFALWGPVAFRNSSILDRALLESFRAIMILGALFTGKPSLMSKEEWDVTISPQDLMARPELFMTSTVTPDISLLLRLLAQLPQFVLERDSCFQQMADGLSSHTKLNTVWALIIQLWQDLKSWKENWDINHQKCIFKAILFPSVCLTSNGALATGFDFTDIKVAEAFVMYHVVVILLAGVSLPLFESSFCLSCPVLDAFEGVSESSLISDIKISAMNICRSIESHFRLYQSSQGRPDFYLLFPMHVARQAFNDLDSSSELDCLSQLFDIVLPKTTMGIWTEMNLSDKVIGTYKQHVSRKRSVIVHKS